MSKLMRNRLRCLEGNIKEITSFMDGGESRRIDFNKVHKEPSELLNRKRKAIRYSGLSEEDKARLIKSEQAERIRLTQLYGADCQHDWRVENWGTSWNAEGILIDEENIRIETGYAPPMPIWMKLSKLFPNHILEVLWEEEGYTIESGIAQIQDGEVIFYKDFTPEREAEFRREFGITNDAKSSADEILEKVEAELEDYDDSAFADHASIEVWRHWFTTEEVERFYGVDKPSVLHRLRKLGRLKGMKVCGEWWWSVRDLADLADEYAAKSSEEYLDIPIDPEAWTSCSNS